jgi:mono/diheme cytochrome c family protein
MRSFHYLCFGLPLLIGATLMPAGCSDDEANGDDEGELPGPSRGSAVVLSADDRVAVMVNRDVGSVSVFALAYARDGYSKDGKTSYLPAVTKTAEIPLGAGSEPWQVVLAPQGNQAYVVLRKTQEVVRIDDLRGKPYESKRVRVGSEPTGIAMTPSGKRLFVANWVDGTLSEVDAKSMKVTGTVDLNAALAQTKLLGDVEPRPALAHPRSVAVTSNLDRRDDDESVLVTEYFAQRTDPLAPDGANADTSMVGIVYKYNLSDKSVSVIRLAPLTDLGFKDQANGAAGCFPNQLQSVTIAGAYAFVSSVCASPKGPIGVFTGPAAKACPLGDSDCPGGAAGSCNAAKKCTTNCTTDAECGTNGGKCQANVCAPNVASVKTAHAPVVSVIDIASGTEIPAAAASLNKRFSDLYDQRQTPDDGARRFPHMPADIAFVPRPIFKNGHGTPIDEGPAGAAYVAANAADGVFRVKYDFDARAAITDVGAEANAFINLSPNAELPGQNPVGIAIGYTGRQFALVANDITRNLSVIDLNTQAVSAAVPSTALPSAGSPEDKILKGKRFFDTGMGRWSLKGQGWGSCQTCHTDGLTDNVSWFFARGPRQSTSLDGSFSSKNPKDQRIFNWTAIFDEVDDFELNTRGVSGGVGAIVKAKSTPPVVGDRIDIAALGHSGLAGSAAQAANPANPAGLATPGVLTDWEDVTTSVRPIRSPRAASTLDPYRVEQGRKVFEEAQCQGCHGGEKWTISTLFYEPSVANTAAVALKAWTPPTGFPHQLLPASTPQNQLMRFPSANGALDQLQCILRPVGTFGVQDGRAGAAELRADMKTKGQGDEVDGKGFNPPSLLAVNVGAPYLHAGGALTLESLFSATFSGHSGALKQGVLDDPEKIRSLVAYLLSVDEDQAVLPIPQAGAQGGDFCASP